MVRVGRAKPAKIDRSQPQKEIWTRMPSFELLPPLARTAPTCIAGQMIWARDAESETRGSFFFFSSFARASPLPRAGTRQERGRGKVWNRGSPRGIAAGRRRTEQRWSARKVPDCYLHSSKTFSSISAHISCLICFTVSYSRFVPREKKK